MVLDVVSSIYVSLLYVVTKILSAFESKVLYKSNSDTYGILSLISKWGLCNVRDEKKVSKWNFLLKGPHYLNGICREPFAECG